MRLFTSRAAVAVDDDPSDQRRRAIVCRGRTEVSYYPSLPQQPQNAVRKRFWTPADLAGETDNE